MNLLITRLQNKHSRNGYLAVGISLLISYLIWIGSMWYYDDWYENRWHYPAKIGSHGATLLMCWSFILSTRFHWVERLFGGLDEVYQAHRYIGEAATYLIFLHPISLAMDRLPGLGNYFSFFLFSADWVRNTGIIAILSLIVLVTVSIYIKIRYHIWKQTHHFFGLLFVLIIAHGVLAKGEIVKYPLLCAWFAIWCGAALASYLYIRLLFRWIGPQFDYVVARLEEQPDDITEIFLKPKRRALKSKPGQFIYLSLESETIGVEAHPFSISNAPEDSEIRLSVKRSGDWTKRLKKLREGTAARIWGPYGRLAIDFLNKPDRDTVLIGGGIGITPFLGMLHSADLSRRSGKTLMIYTVEDKDTAPYIDEISKVVDEVTNVDFFLHVSGKDNFLNKEYLTEKIGEFDNKLYLLCGPGPMMETVQEILLDADVSVEDITTEDFNIR